MTAVQTVGRTDDAMGVARANLTRMSGRVVVRGAISALCAATGILFLLAAATFQPSWANHRHFDSVDSGRTLWTVMVSLLYPFVAFAIVPLAWVCRRVRAGAA